MTSCFAPDCDHNSYREKCKFFRFPKETDKLNIWTKACRRADRNPRKYDRLCSCHFPDEKKENYPSIFKAKECSNNSRKLPKVKRKWPLGSEDQRDVTESSETVLPNPALLCVTQLKEETCTESILPDLVYNKPLSELRVKEEPVDVPEFLEGSMNSSIQGFYEHSTTPIEVQADN